MKDIIEIFENILNDKTKNENDIQSFLESNTKLISTPFLLNHHLHYNVIITKLKISDSLISDFAYLTKSSDFWNLVLVEIEDPKKRIFTSNNEQINFTADFNHAYDQISDWKAYIDQYPEEILKRIEPLTSGSLRKNPIRFKYVLIYGRSEEKLGDERRTRRFALKNTEDTRVMTFDSLISAFKSSPYHYEKMIISQWREGYKVNSVPTNLSSSIFAYLHHSQLKLEREHKDILIKQGYEIEKWEKGEPLVVNHKYTKDYLYPKKKIK